MMPNWTLGSVKETLLKVALKIGNNFVLAYNGIRFRSKLFTSCLQIVHKVFTIVYNLFTIIYNLFAIIYKLLKMVYKL